MNIIFLHSKNTQNYGSFMMTINAVKHLRSIFPQANFYVELNTIIDEQRLHDELDNTISFTAINSVPLFDHNKKIIRDFKRVQGYKTQSQYIKSLNPNLIVYLGGDDFSEYYNKHKVMVELFWTWQFSQHAQILFLGHTIGPFTSYRKSLVKTFLSKSHIITRDDKSKKHLIDDLKVPHVTSSHDLAFLNLPLQGRKDILDTYHLRSDEYITCVPSGLHTHYTHSYQDYIENWKQIIYSISQNPHLKDKNIVFLAHVLTDNKVDDGDIIQDILTQLNQEQKLNMDNIISITNLLLASEARSILGHGYLTISGRMHATVSTFQMGKPAIPLSYSVKYAGVIGQSLQRPELIIEATDNHLWKSGEIVTQVNQKIDYVIDNYSFLRTSITNRVATIQSELQECIDTIIQK